MRYSIAAWMLLAVLTPGGARATVLTFTGGVDYQLVNPAEGQRVTSINQNGFVYGAAGGWTPNVTVTYGPESRYYRWFFGELEHVVWSQDIASKILTFTLTADPGYLVRLESFDLAGFAGDYYPNGLTVKDESGATRFELGRFLVRGSLNFPFYTRITPDVVGSSLTMRVDLTNLSAGDSTNVGYDNIRFSQMTAVPEPSAWALLGIGLTTGLVLTWRRQERSPHPAT